MNPITKKKIKVLKKAIDQRLEALFKKEIQEAKKIDKSLEEATRMVADFTLRGGKRIRAILMYYGYLAGGGKRKKAMLDAALSMEIAHSFLLIHDDIIDNDMLRRGKPTLHKAYEKLFWKLRLQDREDLGYSMAILCGNIAYTLANKILTQADFEEKNKIKAIFELQEMINHTIAGEIIEILDQFKGSLDAKRIMKIYNLKTAKYTVEGPLLLGSILAGASPKTRKTLSEYAVYLGVAFQIHDDLIDIFGDPEETGKDLGSDLKEGKKTLLVLKTLEKASPQEKKIVNSILGNKKITLGKIKQFRRIAKRTKALEYCETVANNLSLKAKETLLNSAISGQAKDFLLESADYIIERKQ